MSRTRWAWVCTVAMLSSTAASSGETWPGWRGPSRDGHDPGATWPERLTGSVEKLWHRALGPSYSGPIIGHDLVFVTETLAEKEEVVRALDVKTGVVKWSTRWDGALRVPFFAKENGSWIRSTPYYDGERVYVAGMRDVLACLDAKTGKELWRIDFVERFSSSVPTFGFVCSPLVTGGFVYVQAAGALVKLNAKDR